MCFRSECRCPGHHHHDDNNIWRGCHEDEVSHNDEVTDAGHDTVIVADVDLVSRGEFLKNTVSCEVKVTIPWRYVLHGQEW